MAFELTVMEIILVFLMGMASGFYCVALNRVIQELKERSIKNKEGLKKNEQIK